VLFKRKPVQFLPVPEIEDESQEVTLHSPSQRSQLIEPDTLWP